MPGPRDDRWIGKFCADGRSFDKLARLYAGVDAEHIYFVDHTNGREGNDGSSWDDNDAFDDIVTALDYITASENDYIFVRGSKAYGAADTPITLSSSYNNLHIIGLAMLVNPRYPEIAGSIYRSAAEDQPLFTITGQGIELAGFSMCCNWTSSTRGGAGSKANINVLRLDGDAAGTNYAWIHNCRFPAWWSKVGIDIVGSSYNLIEHCDFEDYSTYCGIQFNSSVRNPTHNHIRNCRFNNNKYGIEILTGITPYDWIFENLLVQRIGTSALYLGNYASNYGIIRNLVGQAAVASLFTGGSAAATIANLWANYKITGADIWGNDGPLTA